MKKTLITGVAGFAGYHLVDLLNEDYQLYGLDHKPREGLTYLDEIDFRAIDINDQIAIEDFVLSVKPDYIFHLAALSSVAHSWKDQQDMYKVNVLGQLNVLSAAVKLESQPRTLIACSSHEYGAVLPDEQPISEDTLIRPDSPYAASKVCQDFIGLQYYLGFNLPVIRVRSFNHTGPFQNETFVCSDFAKQIAEIEIGKSAPEILVGNLDAKRDFTDVRDVVRAYKSVTETGSPGEAYNVCSGKAYSAGEILEKLLALTKTDITVKVDPAKNRPSDIPVLIGNNSKIKKDTNWSPSIAIDDTLRDLLNWWRDRLRLAS